MARKHTERVVTYLDPEIHELLLRRAYGSRMPISRVVASIIETSLAEAGRTGPVIPVKDRPGSDTHDRLPHASRSSVESSLGAGGREAPLSQVGRKRDVQPDFRARDKK